MFRVESCLRACTWDPAHGKPYASAQSELSFRGGGERGVDGGGAESALCARHAFYPYCVFLEPSEQVAAPPGRLSEGTVYLEAPQSQLGLRSLTQVALEPNLGASHRTSSMPHRHQVGFASPTNSSLSPLSSLPWFVPPSIPRGVRESREDFRAAGGDRLSVPSTYTNGRISAPHKNN